MAEDKNLETGQRVQEKFDFYLVALTFAVVGLAIQTGSSSLNAVAIAAELLGRFALVVSGVIGLYRLSRIPTIYLGYSAQSEDETAITATNGLMGRGQSVALHPTTGEPKPLTEHKDELKSHLSELRTETGKWVTRIRWAYKLQWVTFVSGSVLLAFGRSWLDFKWLLSLLFR